MDGMTDLKVYLSGLPDSQANLIRRVYRKFRTRLNYSPSEAHDIITTFYIDNLTCEVVFIGWPTE